MPQFYCSLQEHVISLHLRSNTDIFEKCFSGRYVYGSLASAWTISLFSSILLPIIWEVMTESLVIVFQKSTWFLNLLAMKVCTCSVPVATVSCINLPMWNQYSPALLLAETAVLRPVLVLGEVDILLEILMVSATVTLVVAVLLEPSSS